MRGWNWIAKSMLFLEQKGLAEHWGQLGSQIELAMSEEQSRMLTTPLSVLHCPTRRAADAYPLVESFFDRYGPAAARTDYAMNGGAAEQLGDSHNWIEVKEEGIWRLGELTPLGHVRDGLSNTYLIGEKAMDSDKYVSGTDFGDRAPALGYADLRTGTNSSVRFAARSTAQDKPDNCLSCHDFGSAHSTNWNTSLADGSVRSVSYGMDLEIHRATASIRGQEVTQFHEN